MASINNCTALHLITMWQTQTLYMWSQYNKPFGIFEQSQFTWGNIWENRMVLTLSYFLLPNMMSLPSLEYKCGQTTLPLFHWHEWTMAKRGTKSGSSPPIWVALHVMQKTIMSPFLLANMSQSPKKGKSLPFKVISVLCNCIWELFHFCAFQCQS